VSHQSQPFFNDTIPAILAPPARLFFSPMKISPRTDFHFEQLKEHYGWDDE
jgi:hypothetical protein